LAASSSGIGLATFLSLSHATGLYGLLSLFHTDQKVGHRKWCTTRYFHILILTNFSVLQIIIQIVLSVILLSSVSFTTTYIKVGSERQVFSGVSPFNKTLAFLEFNPANLQIIFLSYAAGLLVDPTQAFPSPLISNDCKMAHEDCHSYIIPTTVDKTAIVPSELVIPTGDPNLLLPITPLYNSTSFGHLNPLNYPDSGRSQATTFAVLNSGVYQLE